MLIALIYCTPLYADTLTASVDRNQLAINETLTLRLRYDGSGKQSKPDFELLTKDFEILSQQTSNQYRIFNGETESFIEWTLSLAPLKQGKLFIPSLHLHGKVSDAIPVTVTKAGQAPAGSNQQAFLEVEFNKEQLYVQEQLLVKVRLYTTVGLHDIATDPLKIANAHVEKVDEQHYERRINGVVHAVYEITYAVFPESSGQLQIPALRYIAVVGPRDPFSLFNRNTQRIRLLSEPKTLTVQPKPASYSGSQWLPASSLGLVQSWSNDPQNFKVGEPISRIISLRAEGLRAAQLPPLPKLQVEGLKTYPDQPQQKDLPSGQGITGSSTETTAIVATKPGNYELPAIDIAWWDSKTQQQRSTQLPAFRFQVSGASIAAATPPDTHLQSAPRQPTTTASPGLWQKVAIAAIASHLLWVIYLLYLRKKMPTVKKPSKKDPVGLSLATTKLKQAAGDANPAHLQQALINWLNTRWPECSGSSLAEINLVLKFDEITELQEILNGALYLSPPKPLDEQKIQRLIQQLIKRKRVTSTDEQPILPGLFTTSSPKQ